MLLGLHIRQHGRAEGCRSSSARHDHDQRFVRVKPVLKMNETDLCFSASKMFFSYGLGNSLLLPVPLRRATVLWPENPIPKKSFRSSKNIDPLSFFRTDPFRTLLRVEKKYDLSSLRICLSSGEPLPPAIFHQWKERLARAFGRCRLHRSNPRLSRQPPGKSQGRKQRRSHAGLEAKSSTTRGVRCRWAKWEVSWSRETPIRPTTGTSTNKLRK